jgi:LacI family transcriptional regulator
MKSKPVVVLLMDRYFAAIHKSISNYAVQAGWMLDATMAVASERYDMPQADAIIAVYTITNSTRDWLRKHEHIPTVHVWMSEADTQQGWSGTAEDGLLCGQQVAEYFLQRGFLNYAFYQRLKGQRSDLRWFGFKKTLEKRGISAIRFAPGRKIIDSTTWLSKKLSKLPKPLALFVQDDLRGAESVYACNAEGLNIPDDVSIIGVGNDELMTHSCGTPLSSVDVQMTKLAIVACEMLQRRISHKVWKQEVIRIPPSGVIPRYSSDSRSVDSVFVARMIQHIRTNLHKQLEANDVAKALRCSRRWLDYECMRTLKHTCSGEIIVQRILRAKQLLADTDFPVASIAAQVGLQQMPRFYRNFKVLVRQTPAEYRRQVGEK